MHIVLWRYRTRPGREAEFEAAHGNHGPWEQLFRSDTGYLGTELLRATDGTYLTMDRWSSAEAYEAFRKTHAAEYAKLDSECEALTTEETPLGAVEA